MIVYHALLVRDLQHISSFLSLLDSSLCEKKTGFKYLLSRTRQRNKGGAVHLEQKLSPHQTACCTQSLYKWWVKGDDHLLVSAYLESEGLIEDGIECFLVNLCVKLFLLIREDEDLDVGVWGATTVHGEQIGCLQDSHSQLRSEDSKNNSQAQPELDFFF